MNVTKSVFAYLAAATLVATPALADDASLAKHAVDVRNGAVDDAKTEAFATALRTALPRSEQLRVQSPDEEDDLALMILSKVEPEGRKFAYSVDLMKVNPGFSPSRLGSFAGKCREDKLADCAQQVVDEASRAARKADKG